MNLSELAQQLFTTSNEIAEKEKVRTKLRQELFDLATEENDQPFYNLPTKSVELPEDFLEIVGLTEEQFFISRYPGWKVIASKDNVYIIKKLPQYIGFEYVDPETHIKVSKQIRESAPEVDWITLEKEDSELFSKLAKPVISWEFDEEIYNKLVEEQPEIVSVLQRHLILKTPTQTLPKPAKVEE